MSGNEAAIAAEGLGKRYRLRGSASRSLKSAALDLVTGRSRGRRDFWALRGVNFVVRRGETLGIIGANGAGKSTLLALLAGTTAPTEGRVTTRGAISSLLELGAGFHPDLTGRENVFLAGAIMGLSRRQMRARLDAVVSFAGIEPFLDQPVRHYSSGMYVRLGFAVAVEVDPDILLIDEVLAVGDADFQRKCLARMKEFKDSGKTMLIISHDLPTIGSISDRILLLEEGRVRGLGDPGEVVETYRSLSRRKTAEGRAREWGTGEVRITGVELRDETGAVSERFRLDGALEARIAWRAAQRIENPVFGFAISDADGRVIHGSNTQIAGFALAGLEGEGRLCLRIEPLTLAAGTYLLSFSVHSADHRRNYHRLDNRFAIAVESDKTFDGCVDMHSEWRCDEE